MMLQKLTYPFSALVFNQPWNSFESLLPPDYTSLFVLIDENIEHYYAEFLETYNVITIPAGEEYKEMSVVNDVIDTMIQNGADRNSFLLAIGGGVVCDLTGFIASIFKRGISFGFIPTTLLAQVDASVGGKTGVNFEGIKNQIGTFNHPRFVLFDCSFFSTLPLLEWKSGLGEVLKTAIIGDPSLFDKMSSKSLLKNRIELEKIEEIVSSSLAVKTALVQRDEKEQNERQQLNLGHTFGHLFELEYEISHGEAVAAGIRVAVAISKKLNICSEKTYARIIEVLDQNSFFNPDKKQILASLTHLHTDKKRKGDSLSFVVIEEIGKVTTLSMTLSELTKVISDA